MRKLANTGRFELISACFGVFAPVICPDPRVLIGRGRTRTAGSSGTFRTKEFSRMAGPSGPKSGSINMNHSVLTKYGCKDVQKYDVSGTLEGCAGHQRVDMNLF